MNVICVVNQKGGVAKTTTVSNLGAALALRGLKTLLIDLDPQANLTLGLGADASDGPYGLPDVLLDSENQSPLAGVVRRVGGQPDLPLFLAPGHLDMARCESLLSQKHEQPVYRLRLALEKLNQRFPFDWVLIDCPPSLGLLTQNGVVASRWLVVPTQPNLYAFAGIDTLNKMMAALASSYQFEVELLGVLLTMYDRGTRLHRTISGVIQEKLGEKVFDTVIYKSVRLAEAEIEGKPVVLFDPRATGAQSYVALAEEIIQRTGNDSSGGK